MSFLMYSITFILYFVCKQKFVFVGLRFIEGLVEGILVVMLTDIAIHLSKKHNRGFYMGIFGFSFGIGMIIGPIYSGVLYIKYGIDAVFLVNCIIGIFGILCSFFLHTYTIHKEESLRFSVDILKLMAYYSPAILRRVYLFSFAIFLPIYVLQVLELTVKETSRLFMITAIMLTIFGPISGKLVDKISVRLVVIIGTMLMSICCIGIFVGMTFMPLFYGMLACFGFVMPAGMKFFADLVKEHKNRTQILGIAGTTTEIATVFVAIIVPFIAEINIASVWLFLGLVGILTILPFLKKI